MHACMHVFRTASLGRKLDLRARNLGVAKHDHGIVAALERRRQILRVIHAQAEAAQLTALFAGATQTSQRPGWGGV